MRFIVTASAWNEMVDYIFRHRLLSLLSLGQSGWAHPWFTSPAWNAEKERWEATVNPGFVNGQDVTVQIGDPLNTASLNTVPLTDFPSIPLTSTRAITSGAPDFFAALGVRDVAAPTEDQLEQGILEVVSGLPSDSAQQRQLRACDIVLRCTRPVTTITWAFGSISEASFAQFKVGVSGSSQSRYSLHVMAEWTTNEPMSYFDRLNGGTNDPGYDEAVVCTVFFLSPPGVGEDYELDGTWQAFVRHELFWNADHIVALPSPSALAQNLQIDLAGLGNAAGAQFNVNQLLATNNDAFAAAQQFLTSREVTGRITTPGHVNPPDWDRALQPDPPFPFKGRR